MEVIVMLRLNYQHVVESFSSELNSPAQATMVTKCINFAHVICQREKGLQRRFQKVSADRLGFRAPATFQVAIPSAPVCRLRPSLRLGIRQVPAVLCVRARNRILPFHAPPDPDESLAMRSSPMPRQRHRNGSLKVRYGARKTSAK